VRTVGLTVETKLRFQISSALCERDLRFRYDYEQIKAIKVKAITTTTTKNNKTIFSQNLEAHLANVSSTENKTFQSSWIKKLETNGNRLRHASNHRWRIIQMRSFKYSALIFNTQWGIKKTKQSDIPSGRTIRVALCRHLGCGISPWQLKIVCLYLIFPSQESWTSSQLLRSLSERQLTWTFEELEDCDSSLSFSDNKSVSAQGFAGDVRPPCIKILLSFNFVALWKIRPPEIRQFKFY